MEDMLADLFQPDILLPEGYWETVRSKTSLPPEKMLMLAVLEDAIHCIRKHGHEPQSRTFREAVDWILEEQSDWPFCFVNICGILGFDSDYLREGLLAWQGKKVVKNRAGATRLVPTKALRQRGVVLELAARATGT
ncbi:MAG: hypothetical protein HYV04_11615 [Deltaproteobacteria bacterium]|nr:hypothetical protein [Deltaproteobacteria bacterium]